MATVAALPAPDRSSFKPANYMGHHFRDPRAGTGRSGKRKPKHGEAFDPEDLTRRLTAVIEDQKAKTERRRASRVAREAADQHNGMYHHVPKVAAAAFERTTTPDALRQIHKLAQPAARTHLEALHTEHPQLGYAATLLQKTQAIDQASLERDMLRSRNQFQMSPQMQNAAEADFDRDLYKLPQRTFHTEPSHVSYQQNPTRPLSTGDIFSEDEEIPVVAKSKTRVAFAEKDRNDWAQRDGDIGSRQHKMEWAKPFLRRKDSLWIIMRVKKEKSARQDKDEGVAAGNGTQGSPPADINKGGKARFLDRFKRHSS